MKDKTWSIEKKAILNKAKYLLRFVQNTAAGKQTRRLINRLRIGAKADNRCKI